MYTYLLWTEKKLTDDDKDGKNNNCRVLIRFQLKFIYFSADKYANISTMTREKKQTLEKEKFSFWSSKLYMACIDDMPITIINLLS